MRAEYPGYPIPFDLITLKDVGEYYKSWSSWRKCLHLSTTFSPLAHLLLTHFSENSSQCLWLTVRDRVLFPHKIQCKVYNLVYFSHQVFI
jgi:hypothetical protein